MDIKSYMDILKWVMKSQIDYVREESNSKADTEYMAGFYQGVERGLELALEKIDASMFLAEKE